MTQYIDKDVIKQAKEKARNTFNSLPYETRAMLANGYDRLLEVELLLSKGDNFSISILKKRKCELEKWLLDWYKENKQ